MTIRKQLLTAILLAGIPLLILQAYTIVDRYNNEKRLILKNEAETAQTIASLVEVGLRHLVEHQRMVGRFIAQHPGQTREALAWVRRSSPLIVRAAYFRPDGTIALQEPPAPDPLVNTFDRPYFQALVHGKDWAVSDLLISRARGDPIVGVAVAVRDQEGRLKGVLGSALKPDAFLPLLSFKADEGTYFGIVDGSGRVIASNLSGDFPWEKRDWSNAPGIRTALAGTSATVDHFTHPMEGTALMGAWVPVPSLGWAVGVLCEINREMQPVRRAGFIQLGSLASVVLLSLVLAVRLAGRFSRPIMRLAETARGLGEGDLARRAEVKGADEVNVLVDAFNKMAEGIGSSQATLTRQAEALTRKASELQVLHELGRQLDSTLAVEDLLKVALAKVKELVGADLACISIFEESTGGLLLRSNPPLPAGSLPALVEAQVESWTSGEAARREEPHLADRVSPQHGLSALAAVIGGIASVVDVPLRAKGKAIGTLTLTSRTAGRFTEQDIPFLSSVASVVAVAIDNARLYGEALEKTGRLAGLIRTSAKVAGTLQMEEVLRDIAEEAANLLGVEGAGFRLLEGDHLVVAGKYGLAYHLMRRSSLRVGESLSGRVAQEGRPVSVPDIREGEGFLPEHQAAAMLHGAVAYLGVPLRYRGRTIGVLNVYGKERRTFHEREVSLLSAFADHAAIALENARLYALSQRRLERAQALHETGQAISSTLDLPHLFDLILAKTAEHLKVSRCDLHRTEMQGDRTVVTILAGRGFSPGFSTGLELLVGEGTTGKAIALRRAVWTANILTDPAIWLSPLLRARIEAEGFRAALSAPILVQGEPIGVLFICRDEDEPFEDEEVEFLQALANQAGLAMHNARLFAELRGQTDRLESLIRMSRLIESSLELDQVLTTIVRTCTELLGMDAATLRILDERTGALETRVDHGLTDPASRARRSFPPGVGFIGRVLAERGVLTSANFAEDPRIENREWAQAEGLVAAVGVPLLIGDKVLGTLSLYKRGHQEISAADIALLSSFASHAAIAIQNARLYAQTKKDAEAMTLLVRELDHRVRNNLTAIIGLLSMGLGRKGQLTAEEMLKACVDRVQSLAVIHDLLARDQFKELDVRRLVEAMAEAAVRGLTWGKNVEITVDAPPLQLPPKWLSALAMAANELIMNALKHGLRARDAGRIQIQVREGEEEIRLEVRDNGVGVPSGTEQAGWRGVGLDIVATLVQTDLRGEFQLRNEGGAVASIRFPKPRAVEV
jgi:two-component system, sensor histidine kinase PdtaS